MVDHNSNGFDRDNSSGASEAQENFSDLLRSFAPRGQTAPPDSNTPRRTEEPVRDTYSQVDAPIVNKGEVYFSSLSARSAGRRSRDAGRVYEVSASSTPPAGKNNVREAAPGSGDGVYFDKNRPQRTRTVPGTVVASYERPTSGAASVSASTVPAGRSDERFSSSASGASPANAGRKTQGSSGRSAGVDARTVKAKKRPSGDGKKKLGKKIGFRIVVTLLVLIIVAGSAAALTLFGISCANDILAVDRPSTIITVEIGEKMSTRNVIDLLYSKGLIENQKFCQLIAGFLGFDETDKYVPGTYYITANWGLEKMLTEMQDNGEKETVKLTFPEGYGVDRIAKKLESYGVCSADSFFDAIKNYDFSDEFAFLRTITDASDRYRLLEGYLYPDTYDFFVGENAASVVKKFLSNFADKWSDEYAEKAAELGLTTDKVVILASIVEKEANNPEQMKLVSSVLHNRIGRMSVFRNLQCDSTGDYITDVSSDYLGDNMKSYYKPLYDTYVKDGYPVGPICNPGDAAINAVLYPDETDYYFFRHDKKGRIYMAKTQEEQDANGRAIAEAEEE